MKILSYPAVRLVVPFMAGILMSGAFDLLPTFFVVATGLLFLAVLFLCTLMKSPTLLFGIGLNLFMITCGVAIASWKRSLVGCEWSTEKMAYTAVVTEYPRERAHSWLLQLLITGTENGAAGAGQVVWLYVPADSLVDSLAPGDAIAFRGRIEAPDNEGIDDFDYAAYLNRKGVAGTLWVPSADWCPLDSSVPHRLAWRSKRIRKALLSLYEEWPFSTAARALVSAVTLGSKELIDDETRQDFSASGASHVLAVSGLHVGIIYAILGFLFPPFMNVGRLRWIRESVIMSALWGYAYLIGMPLSITRSLIMFQVISLCRCSGRESSSLNSLALAALIILSATPSGIYEAGFQLSFCAVFFILLLQPYVNEIINPESRVARYVWDIVSVSVAAQIGTAPIVMYVFGTFSTYFLLTNIVAIPLMFLTVSLSMLLWAVSPVPLLRDGVVALLNMLCAMLQKSLGWIASLPHSLLEIEIGNIVPVVTAYGLILLLCGYISSKRSRYLVVAAGILASESLMYVILLF